MKNIHSKLIVLYTIITLTIVSGCSKPHLKKVQINSVNESHLDGLISDIVENSHLTKNNSAFKFLREGLNYLKTEEFEKASKSFNRTLSFDPKNSYYQFFNGFAYHLIAETSDPSKLESAKLGYELALKFDPNNWLASAQLGRIYMRKRAYKQAQDSFAHALLFSPENVDLLYVMAKASYLSEDLATARNVIRKAKDIDPDSKDVIGAYSIIMAANGEFPEAKESLATINASESGQVRIDIINQRIMDWERLYTKLKNIKLETTGSDNTASVNNSKESSKNNLETSEESKKPKMVILDVVMIRTEEFDTTNKGFNLLEGLAAQFNSELNEDRDRNSNDTSWSTNRVFSRSLTVPQINYNLNIFNAGDDRNEILARPTLIALDGEESTFFSGSELNIALEGERNASLQRVNIGVTLKFTPTFLENGSIQFKTTAKRTFFEFGATGSFKQSVRTSKNEVTANVIMDFEQTLILSGLREKETSESKSGVPILRDIPIIQNVFSNEKTQDFHKSILILMTPHRVNADPNNVQSLAQEYQGKHLENFKNRYGKEITITENISHVMEHLQRHDSYNALRDTDIFDKAWWGNRESINRILGRALSFLYY